jgi:hypothetical protein
LPLEALESQLQAWLASESLPIAAGWRQQDVPPPAFRPRAVSPQQAWPPAP